MVVFWYQPNIQPCFGTDHWAHLLRILRCTEQLGVEPPVQPKLRPNRSKWTNRGVGVSDWVVVFGRCTSSVVKSLLSTLVCSCYVLFCSYVCFVMTSLTLC